MTDLTYRAERALLGALLASRAQGGVPDGIEAADFGDPRHRAIFAALAGGVREPSGLLGRIRLWLTGLPSRGQVRDFGDYLAGLPASCPDPRHLSSYAQIVAEASGSRRLAARTEQDTPELGRLAGAAAWLAREAEKTAANPRWPVRGTHAASDAALPRETMAAARAVSQDAARTAARPAQERSRAQKPVTHQDLEELVLADLMQRPAGNEEIFNTLVGRVFTSEARREIYRSIRRRIQEGEPVDPLIVAWEISRARDLRLADSSPDGEAPDPGYALRIGALDVAPGTAAMVGRVLLADHFCTMQWGARWQYPQQATQPGGPASEPGQTAMPVLQPQPGPSPDPHTAAPAAALAGEPPAQAADAAVMEPPPPVPAPGSPVQRM